MTTRTIIIVEKEDGLHAEYGSIKAFEPVQLDDRAGFNAAAQIIMDSARYVLGTHDVHVEFTPLPAGDPMTPFNLISTSAGIERLKHEASTPGYSRYSETAAVHGAIIVGKRKSSELEPFRWVNTFIANAKTAITGTYHHFDFDKYRHRYLAEAQYRVNRRFDLASLVGRMVHTCARTRPCPEKWLRQAVPVAG